MAQTRELIIHILMYYCNAAVRVQTELGLTDAP